MSAVTSHVASYGASVSVPIDSPSTKNSTSVTVFSVSSASAVTVISPCSRRTPASGAVMRTFGRVVAETPLPSASTKFRRRSPAPGNTT
ncbi:Uncharacterised protein [Mycobacteroides abscessus]|nr:Uncharacterised protein [Mycobacteroides abscessus]